MSLTCFDHLGSSFPLAYLSVDVTGALVPHPPKCMVFGHSFLCTCVSVHRRDRCTRTPPIHVFVTFVHVLCTPLFLVFASVCFLPYRGQAHYALHKHCLCCSPSLWWSCGSLHELPSGARGIVLFVLLLVRLVVLLVFVAFLVVLVWALLLLLLSVLLCCGSFLRPLCLPSPAGCLVWCSGPACALACWYLPLGIWLQL